MCDNNADDILTKYEVDTCIDQYVVDPDMHKVVQG